MADRYYVNSPLERGPFALTGAEAHHLAAVCRLRAGDRVFLFNGDGREYPASIDSIGRREVILLVEEPTEPARELPHRLEVAAPLPKGDRGPFLVEKLTELGVHTFVPLRTRRSVVHPGDSKRDRLERHVIEASKQCGRNVLMQIAPLTEWEVYFQETVTDTNRLIAHPSGGGNAPTLRAAGGWRVAVGPEGGFTEEEVEMARAAGWQTVALGPRILRVETAAIALAARLSLPL